jgi:ABC-type sugar transport system ATPase subunit
LRPEAFSHAPDGESSADLAIEVMDVEYLGHETLVHFSPPSLPASPAPGDDVATLVSGVFTARLSPDFSCHAGQTIGLNIDKHQLTLFDINGQVMA